MSMEFPETFDPQTEEGDTLSRSRSASTLHRPSRPNSPPQSGDGHALTLTWKILEGDHEGRQILQWLSFCIRTSHAGHRTQDPQGHVHRDRHQRGGQGRGGFPAQALPHPREDRERQNGRYEDRNKISRVSCRLRRRPTAAAPVNQPHRRSPATAVLLPYRKPAKPATAPRDARTPRPGPAGKAPWHAKR